MNLQTALKQTIGEFIVDRRFDRGELTIEVAAAHWREVAERLERSEATRFEQCVDICGIDYLEYGRSEWAGEETVSYTGYSRAVEPSTAGWLKFGEEPEESDSDRPRFAVVAHLLSYTHNWRLRVRVYCPDDQAPSVPSVVPVWNGVNWFEREAFDLFGIFFEDHPDLRRILTDYGFVGHPLRKDFPMIGNVEVRYDDEKGRVVYEPVSIEPRVLVPKVHREDNRYIDLDEG